MSLPHAERTIFLADVALADARARFTAALDAAGVRNEARELVALADALDRVTAAPAFARLSSPHYHACAMDGIAVRSAATAGARETAPRELRLGVDAVEVDTGDPLPPWADAVVMIEEVERRGAGIVAVRSAVAPFTHVRPIGEDIVATEAVVPERRLLGPADLAAAAGAGLAQLEVVRLPRVAILTSGDELVDPSVEAPARGAIVDSNAVLLAACVRRYGGEPVALQRVPDDLDALERAVRAALAGADVVVVNAGSSAGSADFTAAAFERVGEVLVHGVAIRPGHPFIAAMSRGGVPLLGIPGYPVSAALCADLFLRPLVERLAHRDPPDDVEFDVTVTRKLVSSSGEDEFVRAVAARVDGRLVATPLRRGAATIASLARANCTLVIPRFVEGVHAGTVVRAKALRPRAAIEKTLLAVGSHDVAIDLLAGALARRGLELVSANVGSIAGLVALRDGATHLAGTHVLDARTLRYNDAAVARFGPRERVALVHFAEREQGLIVAPGNPLGLRDLAAVARSGARFVNRQRDAGTRILLDAMLQRAAIEPDAITGYERIEFTHLAVAALVADGAADCGMGIRAAAVALGCDFVPLATEPYELAVRANALESDDRLQTLVAVLRSNELRAAVDALPGYDAARSGSVREVAGGGAPA